MSVLSRLPCYMAHNRVLLLSHVLPSALTNRGLHFDVHNNRFKGPEDYTDREILRIQLNCTRDGNVPLLWCLERNDALPGVARWRT